MKTPPWIPFLFGFAALYDGLLGLLFLTTPLHVFALFKVAPPNHLAYAQFPAALLIVFALMFVSIARDPAGRRGLIPYGILLKVAYCGVAGGHWLASGIPGMFQPMVVADLIFGVLFAWAYVALRATTAKTGG
jgi:hypothetical protein